MERRFPIVMNTKMRQLKDFVRAVFHEKKFENEGAAPPPQSQSQSQAQSQSQSQSQRSALPARWSCAYSLAAFCWPFWSWRSKCQMILVRANVTGRFSSC
jgi:hypothetical protein